MKIELIENNLTKLCHARPGDVIRTSPGGPLHLVCLYDLSRPRLCDPKSNGLYSEENPVFAVNLETGLASPLPHLSSKVEIVRDVAVRNSD